MTLQISVNSLPLTLNMKMNWSNVSDLYEVAQIRACQPVPCLLLLKEDMGRLW